MNVLPYGQDITYLIQIGAEWKCKGDNVMRYTGQNKLSPMQLFFHSHNVKLPKFSSVFRKY